MKKMLKIYYSCKNTKKERKQNEQTISTFRN
jgi:hypothetical protein